MPLRKSPLLGKQGSQACVQNRKCPFQEHQRQEGLLAVPANRTQPAASALPLVRWVTLCSLAWPNRSPEALFVQEVEGSCCLWM